MGEESGSNGVFIGAAELLAAVVNSSVTARAISWRSRVEDGGGNNSVRVATAIVASVDLLDRVSNGGAASGLGGIVGSRTTAVQGLIFVLVEDVAVTAKLGSVVLHSVRSAAAVVGFVSAADLSRDWGDGDWLTGLAVWQSDWFTLFSTALSVVWVVTASTFAAFEVVIDSASVTALLGLWVVGGGTAAFSSVLLTVDNNSRGIRDSEAGADVVVADLLGFGGFAAKIVFGIVGLRSSTTAILGSIGVLGRYLSSAAN